MEGYTLENFSLPPHCIWMCCGALTGCIQRHTCTSLPVTISGAKLVEEDYCSTSLPKVVYPARMLHVDMKYT